MKHISINGKILICPHCGNDDFSTRDAQLNTAGMTLFNLDWLDKTAQVFVCSECGRLEWFLNANIERPEEPDRDVLGTPWENDSGYTSK